MTSEEIIATISKYSLTARCLPHVVITHWTYTEGDENIKYVNAKGEEIKAKRSVVIKDYDLEHFKTTPAPSYSRRTPEQRYEQWRKLYPTGQKLLREEREVENGGWWYVKQTPNTDSTVRFSRKSDKFFAPTLEEAIKLFLDTKK